ELRLLLGHEQMLEEARAETLERARDAPALEDIDADAEDHARAATIRAFISRTAAARPTNSACPITACPMLSSTISRTAATGCTLWQLRPWPACTSRPRRAPRRAAACSRSSSAARRAPA